MNHENSIRSGKKVFIIIMSILRLFLIICLPVAILGAYIVKMDISVSIQAIVMISIMIFLFSKVIKIAKSNE